MIERTILHIGIYKTGTSAIQASLKRNAKLLAESGVRLSTVAAPQHWGLQWAALPMARAVKKSRIKGGMTRDELHDRRAGLEADLDSLAAANCPVLVLSDEALSGLKTSEAVTILHDMLRPRSRRIEVVVYLRPQHDRRVSGYTQQLRSGSTDPDVFGEGARDEWQLQYDRILDLWAGAFGDDSVRPRLYQRHLMANGDVVADFMEHVGVDPARLIPVGSVNESLGAEAQIWLRHLNEHLPRFVDGKRNEVRDLLLRNLDATFPGKGMRPNRARAEAFFALFDDVNERVRARWFPDRERLFDASFDGYPEADDLPELTLGKAAEITARVLASAVDAKKPRPDPDASVAPAAAAAEPGKAAAP